MTPALGSLSHIIALPQELTNHLAANTLDEVHDEATHELPGKM